MKREVGFGVAVSEEALGDGAAVPLQGGLEKSMRRAADLGYDCVEWHVRNPRDLDAERLAAAAAACGLRIAAIGTGLEYSRNGLSFTSPDPAVRDRTVDRFREHIGLAARFHAVVFLGLCRGRSPSFAERGPWLDRLAEALLPVADEAGARGVVLGFEPIAFHLTNLLNSTEETLEFLARPGLGSIQLLLDTHHMFLEDRDMEASFRSCKGRIAHVHISDSNRLAPGLGNVDFTRVGELLHEIGYGGAVCLEVLPYPSGEEAARRGLLWMRGVWP